MLKLKLNFKQRAYDIIIGFNVIDQLKIEAGRKIILITDENLAQIAKIMQPHHKIIIPAGEGAKQGKIFLDLCEDILALGIDRNAILIAFGGGVVGDITGFAASILLRGIDFIQIPTTLLAMVDSSVGGKTGINSRSGKNLIGTFYQPQQVICDLAMLETLPPREFRAGYAEVLKYGIALDKEFFFFLQENNSLEEIVHRCCKIKASVVVNDEREKNGTRALLNFGHSFGHALEKIAGMESGELLHGEAVAIGMVLEARLSLFLQTGITRSDVEEITKTIVAAGLPVKTSYQVEQILNALSYDKKNSNGDLGFVLLDSIGKSRLHLVKVEEVRRFLEC